MEISRKDSWEKKDKFVTVWTVYFLRCPMPFHQTWPRSLVFVYCDVITEKVKMYYSFLQFMKPDCRLTTRPFRHMLYVEYVYIEGAKI